MAALPPGRSSRALLLDAVRLGPDDDERAVTAAQLREVVTRLIAAGHWRDGNPPVLVTMDAGYSPVPLTWPRLHQAVHRRGGDWGDWPALKELPVIEGTLIRLAAARPAPGQRRLEPGVAAGLRTRKTRPWM